ALGFARYGLHEPLILVARGLFGAAQCFELKRLPELFCGFARRPELSPTAYPLACAPQAWSAASVFGLLGALLAVSFEPEAHRIRFSRPVLPDRLGEISISNLRLGAGSVDLAIRRKGPDPADVAIAVIRRDGPVEIVVTR
ncbi:MAG: amylo-alpha-1,6-glucosidase, partial [Stellaceae bacterium]